MGSDPHDLDRRNGRRSAKADELFCIMKAGIDMQQIEMHAVVALLEDIPELDLLRGHVGTVVENWAPGVYEVEFSGQDGVPFAITSVVGDKLMVLHHEAAHAVA